MTSQPCNGKSFVQTHPKKFGHRNGRSSCAHSIGKFFLCYIVFFLLKLPPPARPGTTCISTVYLMIVSYCFIISAYSIRFPPTTPASWTFAGLSTAWRKLRSSQELVEPVELAMAGLRLGSSSRSQVSRVQRFKWPQNAPPPFGPLGKLLWHWSELV